MSFSPVQLIKLSYRVRLGIVIMSFVLCLGVYAFIFPITQNGTIIVIPVIFSGWLFGRRGAFICAVTINLVAITITSLILGTIFWPRALLTTTLIGSIALLCIGFVIGYLRYTFTQVETSRLKALHAERQRAIAYEQRFEALQATQQMSLAYEHEKQLNALKDQFIVNVSHELRTPLTEVYGYLELLVDHHNELDNELRTTFLSKATEGCIELILLVNTVLDSTQVSSDVRLPSLEQVSLAQAVDQVLSLFDPRKSEEYHLRVVISESLTVWADKQFLHQVLRNLITNAFKYSPESTTIMINAHKGADATIEDPASPMVCICVKDEGAGIPPGEVPLLFRKFVRLQRDQSGSIRGTGLGLYISKRLVEAMQGRIWVESSGRAGEGSRFCFTLPSIPAQNIGAEEDSLSELASKHQVPGAL